MFAISPISDTAANTVFHQSSIFEHFKTRPPRNISVKLHVNNRRTEKDTKFLEDYHEPLAQVNYLTFSQISDASEADSFFQILVIEIFHICAYMFF